jgi:uncharacterized membrane protein
MERGVVASSHFEAGKRSTEWAISMSDWAILSYVDAG